MTAMNMDDFLVRAVLAGLAISFAAAPLGCFVVWRKMAYFGDATAHSSLLGIALGLALAIPLMFGVAIVAACVAVAVSLSGGRNGFAADTILGVFSHSALALGLVLASLLPELRRDLLETLLGDILAVSRSDVLSIWAGSAVITAVLFWRWRSLLNATFSPELMIAEGGSVRFDKLLLTLSLALFVALSIQLVGVLLISAMLILPAAAARSMAKSPEQMVGFAAIIGACAISIGLSASWFLDTPAGPSIILAATVAFLATSSFKAIRT
jgi:zinc transport system permease protein